jgi:hypothetical protein
MRTCDSVARIVRTRSAHLFSCNAPTCEAIDNHPDQCFRQHWLVQNTRDIQPAGPLRRQAGNHYDWNAPRL